MLIGVVVELIIGMVMMSLDHVDDVSARENRAH